MTWFRIDDKMSFHSKVLGAGNEAFGAWVRMGAHTSSELLDGFIAEHVALSITNRECIDRLLAVRLLELRDGGFVIHDFLDWNPSAKQVAKLRKDRSKAGRAGASKTNGKRTSSVAASVDQLPTTSPRQNVAPSHPVPSHKIPPSPQTDPGTAALAAMEEFGEAVRESTGHDYSAPFQLHRGSLVSALKHRPTGQNLREWVRSSVKDFLTTRPTRNEPLHWLQWLNAGKPRGGRQPEPSDDRPELQEYVHPPRLP